MSTIIIITPRKKPPYSDNDSSLQEFNLEAIDGVRTSDVLRELANTLDEREDSEPDTLD